MDTKIYKVVEVQDYELNRGEPLRYKEYFFSSLEKSQEKFKEIMKRPLDSREETGTYLEVELYQNDNDRWVLIDVFTNYGRALKENEVIVTFKHHRYMNYAYDIDEVRFANPMEYTSDLRPQIDEAELFMDALYNSIDDLMDAYDLKGRIFDKINSGSKKIINFIKENKKNED